MNRAYATFAIKAFDDEQHIIEGIASAPSPDRVGDILESKGAAFNLPLPLLWQHDSRTPIGRVLSAHVTKAGISIKAKIEAGLLPEIDRAWTLIKSGLVRGLSVGFRPLEMEPLDVKQPWGSQRFLKWEWLELSAVTIPANQDASIQTVKSLCASARPGTDARSTSKFISPAAVGASTRTGLQMTPNSEKVTAALAELKAKSARLEELNTREGADDGLSADEQQERDTLTGTVQALAARVSSLKAVEMANGAMAQGVRGAAPDLDVRNQDTDRPRVQMGASPADKLPPGVGLARVVMCQIAGMRRGVSALEIAKHYYRDDPRIGMFLKEAIPAASTQDSTWAGPFVYAQNLTSEFIEFLRPQTIIGRIESFTRIPFNVRIGGQTSGGAGYWVGEGRAKPLTKWDTNATTLYWAKVANIAVISEELARFSNPSAETHVRNELARACLERIDTDFIDPAKSASVGISPASITNGITNLNSSGNDLAAVDADVQAMMSPFALAHLMPTHWIMPNTVALALSLMRTSLGARAFPDINMNGGTFMGLPVITSQYCILGTPANNLVALIAAPEIFLADDGGFDIALSREASLEMDDAPTMSAGVLGSPSGATGTAVVSMFQTNSIAIRCERFINWARKRSSAVVWMDDVQWSPAGS